MKTRFIIVLSIIWFCAPMVFSQSTDKAAPDTSEIENSVKADPKAEIRIRWFGQSSFLITTSRGTRIIIDPVDFKGYHIPPGTTADIVTVSHEHIDHNSIGTVSGTPVILRGTDKDCSMVNSIDTTIKDVRIHTVKSFHDPGHHSSNAIFVFDFDGIRLVHLGDIGTILTAEQMKDIGEVDILMIPVGGRYTIAAPEADSIVNQLDVKNLVIPMHYKTEYFDALPYTAESFLKDKKNVRHMKENELVLDLSRKPGEREYVEMKL